LSGDLSGLELVSLAQAIVEVDKRGLVRKAKVEDADSEE
jgi:hypothetical protein